MISNEEIKYVYVSKSGKKYHIENCHTLQISKLKIKYEEALNKYSPCMICMGNRAEITKSEIFLNTKNKLKAEIEIKKDNDKICLSQSTHQMVQIETVETGTKNSFMKFKNSGIDDKKENSNIFSLDKKCNFTDQDSSEFEFTNNSKEIFQNDNKIKEDKYINSFKYSEYSPIKNLGYNKQISNDISRFEKIKFVFEPDQNYEMKEIKIEKISNIFTPLISSKKIKFDSKNLRFYFSIKIVSLNENKIKLGFCIESSLCDDSIDTSNESSESEFFWLQADKLKQGETVKILMDLKKQIIYLQIFPTSSKNEMTMSMEINKNFRKNYSYFFSPCICLLRKGDKISFN
jgi:hypothetical protein